MRPPLAFLFIAALSLAACGDESRNAAAIKGPRVSVVKAVPRDLVETLQATGTLVAREEVRVTAQVDGLSVIDVKAEEGDKVEKGAVLAVLDDVALKAQLAQNTANLARAEASVTESRKALGRAVKLRTGGFASQEQLDQRTSAAKVSTAEQDAVRAARDDVATRLARARVTAPVAGIVAKRTARLGAIAGAMEPLFILIADGKVELEAEVADTQHNRLKTGQTASITIPGMAAPVKGTIRVVSPQIDPATRLGMIRIALNDPQIVSVGGYARAEIVTAQRSALAVPLSALSYSNGHASVQKIVDNKVVTQAVTTGIVSSGFVEIVSGLQDGEQVVSKAGTFLREGDSVTPVADPS